MTRTVRWAQEAQADREAIFTYLCKEAGLAVASAADEKFTKMVVLIRAFPHSGTVAGKTEEQRKITLSRFPFILVYAVEPATIDILRILHTSSRIAGHYSP